MLEVTALCRNQGAMGFPVFAGVGSCSFSPQSRGRAGGELLSPVFWGPGMEAGLWGAVSGLSFMLQTWFSLHPLWGRHPQGAPVP